MWIISFDPIRCGLFEVLSPAGGGGGGLARRFTENGFENQTFVIRAFVGDMIFFDQ